MIEAILLIALLLQAESNNAQMYDLLIGARDLGADEVAALEQKLERDPHDHDARMQLLGYHFGRGRGGEAGAARNRHILWLIENNPHSPVLAMPYGQILRAPFGANTEYEKAHELWRAQLDKHQDDPVVIGNAADWLAQGHAEEAEALLQRGRKLDPENPRWPQKLEQLYSRRMWLARGEQRKELARQALAEGEAALALVEARSRFSALNDLPHLAIEAGELAKAEKYTRELLDQAEKSRRHWNHGNGIHLGHIALGRIALRNDDIDTARAELLRAGATPGSPQLDSFGPNMTLAAELLERGEKATVLEYLDAVGKFWKMERGQLAQWKKEIEAGRTPDFGALRR